MNSLEKKFKLIDASFKIIETEGWNNFSLKKLAESQKISLKEIINILILSAIYVEKFGFNSLVK